MKISHASLFSLAILVSLSACTTFDPYTGEQKTTKTAIGASIGANGAAIGGGIGYYMDAQEAKLRQQLRG